MRMMRCKAEININPTGTEIREELWPGKEVDFDRVLKEAEEAQPAIGAPADPDYRAGRPARPAVTIALAVAGLEHCFEPVTAETSAGPTPPAHMPGAEE